MHTRLLTPDEPTFATVAAYFRIGLMVGVCAPDEARAWALSIIATLDEPPGEIIEISWYKPLDALLADLSSVEGEADVALASYWLLKRVAELPNASADEVWDRLQQAMRIACYANLQDLFDEFNGLDDELNLAISGVFGEVGSCGEELSSILASFPKAPFNFS